MRQWQGPGYKVTSSEDVFFNSPLRELTLFRFSTPYFEVEPHSGEFSLKLVLQGEERYVFKGREVRLQPGKFLLVNSGETYASVIDSPSESLSIFFRQAEVRDAVNSLTETTEDLLDSPDRTGRIPEVAQIALSHSVEFRRQLRATISACDTNDAEYANEAVRLLLLASLDNMWGVASPQSLAHLRRRGTRDELLSRVLRAHSLIHDSGGLDIDLDSLAIEACLSRYHFLRVFSMVFGETPIASARRVRLERAQRVLERGEDPRQAAIVAGYKDFRAFRRAYQKTFGKFPTSN